MYKNIEFPEGTKYKMLQYCPYDIFSDDYPIPYGYFIWGTKNANDCIIPHKNYLCETFNNFGMHCGEYYYLPTLNVCRVTSLNSSSFAPSVLNMLVFDGEYTGSNPQAQNSNATCVSEIYYNYYYKDTLFPMVKSLYPNVEKIIPYGGVIASLRVLREGEWMNGQTLYFNGQEMEYIGKGEYQISFHQEPRGRYNYVVSDGVNEDAYILGTTKELYFGGNAGIVSYVGNDINEIITDNPKGWYYDETLGGIRNNSIKGMANGETKMTINVPTDTIEIVFGQNSEANYDYLTILSSTNIVLLNTKGLQGNSITKTVSSDDGVFIFKYSKDGSGDTGEDACWIKSITYKSLPPYPED